MSSFGNFNLTDTEFDSIVSDSSLRLLCETAYIKQEVVDFQTVYSIYDSVGGLLGYTATRKEAFLIANRNDLKPHSVN